MVEAIFLHGLCFGVLGCRGIFSPVPTSWWKPSASFAEDFWKGELVLWVPVWCLPWLPVRRGTDQGGRAVSMAACRIFAHFLCQKTPQPWSFFFLLVVAECLRGSGTSLLCQKAPAVAAALQQKGKGREQRERALGPIPRSLCTGLDLSSLHYNLCLPAMAACLH